jgi:heptosyltransferase-1
LKSAPQLAAVERLLVVRLGSMGDMVHTLPAVAALRRALPDASIGWVVEDRWSELLCARGATLAGARTPERPLVDRVHVVDTLAWRQALFSGETRRQALGALGEIRAARYQAAIDFQGAMKSSLLMQWTATPLRLGFAQPREWAARLFYTRAVVAEGAHIIEQNLSLVRPLIRDSKPEFPLPRDAAAESWCAQELRRRGVDQFAIINPGAGWGAKCWPSERYGEVARGLGLSSLINIGPGEEALGRAVEAASGGAAQTITCALGQLIALTRRARLLVGGDTGPLHLAGALGVPVVGIYGPTDPARNGPVGSPNVVLRHASSETSHRRHADTEAGLLNVTAAEVLDAARRLLREVRA